MKSNKMLDQATEILAKTEHMVRHAHQLLRNAEIDQRQFIEIKRLEITAQQLSKRLERE